LISLRLLASENLRDIADSASRNLIFKRALREKELIPRPNSIETFMMFVPNDGGYREALIIAIESKQ